MTTRYNARKCRYQIWETSHRDGSLEHVRVISVREYSIVVIGLSDILLVGVIGTVQKQAKEELSPMQDATFPGCSRYTCPTEYCAHWSPDVVESHPKAMEVACHEIDQTKSFVSVNLLM